MKKHKTYVLHILGVIHIFTFLELPIIISISASIVCTQCTHTRGPYGHYKVVMVKLFEKCDVYSLSHACPVVVSISNVAPVIFTEP